MKLLYKNTLSMSLMTKFKLDTYLSLCCIEFARNAKPANIFYLGNKYMHINPMANL